MILAIGKKFVIREAQTYAHSLSVAWRINLPLTPWPSALTERMGRTTKTIL